MQLEHIEAIERRLWSAADTLRANSNYASNEYFLPVMGLVFLRHAYSRYLAVAEEAAAGRPTRGGRVRPLAKQDFSQRGAIFLRPQAQFDHLVALPDGADRTAAIIAAMESIEADYDSLRGALPKSEYHELDNAVLGQLLRTLNPDELKRVSGDVFGRIYEYFLTQFADQKAHDGGEFFTPYALVSLIAHVLDPERGTVLDPACGSGGMFVQSARTVREHGQSPIERLTFRGLEKNAATIRLARMNLAVHGLEGDIQQAITYYDDPHELLGKADYVMANPPFNVDEIDADKVKADPRLPFGLPGVNKRARVSNGNYVWISYFYSYLNERGKAGFVMSAQASSAGGAEAAVRRKLIETGDVDVMIAIRSNFFYTRTVPCELWFLNRAKPERHRGKVLMIDARGIFRKVTRKICDFSPEQMRNILAIVWLHHGETQRYLDLVAGYCARMLTEAAACFQTAAAPLPRFLDSLSALRAALTPFLERPAGEEAGPAAEVSEQLDSEQRNFGAEVDAFKEVLATAEGTHSADTGSPAALKRKVDSLRPLADGGRDLANHVDTLFKQAAGLIETCEQACDARSSDAWNARTVTNARRAAGEARGHAVEGLEQVRYVWRQARWLVERFPDGELRDVEGLVKLTDRSEIAANDWSLTPGRYVGIAAEGEEGDFDFAETLRNIHSELEHLNAEAETLATNISNNMIELMGQ